MSCSRSDELALDGIDAEILVNLIIDLLQRCRHLSEIRKERLVFHG